MIHPAVAIVFAMGARAPILPASTSDSGVIRNVHVACPLVIHEPGAKPGILFRVTIEHGVIVGIDPEGPNDVNQAQREAVAVEYEIDGRGGFLAPGFYDMHVHLPGVDSELPASFRVEAMGMMLDAGITTARVGRGDHALLALKAAQARGEVAGPRLFLAAPALRRDAFPSLEEAQEQFRIWKAQGFDAVKFLSGPDAADHTRHAELAVECGLRWYGHLPGGPVDTWPLEAQTSLEHASAVERMEALSPETFADDLKKLSAAGVFICPDVDFYYANAGLPSWEALLQRPGLDRLPHGVVDRWTQDARLPNPRRGKYKATVEAFRAAVPELKSAGVKLLISASDPTFSAPGHGYVIEAQHLVEAGYTPNEVFHMATLHGAQCQGEAALRGAIQVGYVADLVLLDEDPRETVQALPAVRMVWQRGVLVRTE